MHNARVDAPAALTVRARSGRLLCLLAVLAVAAPVAAELPLLSAPTERVEAMVPQNVLDTLEVPPLPVRVAARPTLDWLPGLNEASQGESPAPTAEAPKEEPATAPRLQPVDKAPKLIAPREEKPTEPEAKPPTEEAPSDEVVVPPATEKLPLRAPRKLPAPVQKPAPAAKPAAPKAQKKTPPQTEGAAVKPKPAPAAAKPTPPPEPLSRSLRNLRSRMRTVLSFYYRKPLNTVQNDPWELMHSMLSYELHSRVRDGGPRSSYMTAVGHLCFNRPSKRKRMMVLDNNGRIDTQIGVGLQGHKGQLLAMLAQCNVSPDYPIRVEGKEFTIRDLIESEQRSCYSKTELTFKLIGLGHYLDSDARWLSETGETWDIPRLIKEEREQPIRGAACGGTHRLAGLSLAFRRREARGEPIDGEYAEAAKFVSQYQSYAFRLQNSDGSLSTEWFRGPGAEEDIDRRLRTTGHLLEWLVYSLPEDQLRSYRTIRAVNYLTNLLAGNADNEWHNGSIAHALHALVLYDKRVFRPHDDQTGRIAGQVDPTSNLFREYPIYRGVMRNSPPQSGGLFGIFGGTRTGSASSRRR